MGFGNLKAVSLGIVAAALIGSGAMASPLVPNDNNDGVPDLNDAFNIVAGTSFVNNAAIQGYKIDDANDQTFVATGAYTPLIGLTAGNSNTLGFYFPSAPGTKFSTSTAHSGFGFTGDGTLANPFDGLAFTPDPTGNEIGFYLETQSGSTTKTFYSQESLNPDGDHLIAYDLSSFGPISVYADFGGSIGVALTTFLHPILIGWEDLSLPGDLDYDDMMYLVDMDTSGGGTSLPETTTLALFGLGLIGLGVTARRRRTR